MFEKAVDARLLLLINNLSRIPELCENFYLAGGTGLTLQLGHRKSFDIDLFTEKEFNVERYSEIILNLKGRILREERGTIDAIVDGLKLTLLFYPYKMLSEFHNFAGIRLADIKDIACMKIVAISQRAEKKDFYDLYEILQNISPSELKNLFLEKYGEQKINCYHILKSFFYFTDVEDSPDVISLKDIKWDKVKDYFIANEKVLTDSLLC